MNKKPVCNIHQGEVFGDGENDGPADEEKAER